MYFFIFQFISQYFSLFFSSSTNLTDFASMPVLKKRWIGPRLANHWSKIGNLVVDLKEKKRMICLSQPTEFFSDLVSWWIVWNFWIKVSFLKSILLPVYSGGQRFPGTRFNVAEDSNDEAEESSWFSVNFQYFPNFSKRKLESEFLRQNLGF